MEFFDQFKQQIMVLSAFLTILLVFWKQTKTVFLGCFNVGKGIVTFLKSFGQTQKLVQEIHKEVRPNGGSSLNDSVKRVEILVTKSEAREQAKFNLEEIAQWETNANGEIIKVNRRFAELVGHSIEDLMGSNWKNTVYPPDVADVTSKWASVVTDGRDCVIPYRIQRPDGQIVPVIGKGEVMCSPKGDILGWFGTLCPIPPKIHDVPNVIPTRIRVLMVEDAADTRTLFEMGLSPYFEIRMASSGRDAIQQFVDAQTAGHAFDVVILDYEMPGMDGCEVAHEIRVRETLANPTLIAFFTGNKRRVSAEDCHSHQIADIWEKPMPPIELAARIARLLDHAK
jgi:PAS domain S-box-containing protein